MMTIIGNKSKVICSDIMVCCEFFFSVKIIINIIENEINLIINKYNKSAS